MSRLCFNGCKKKRVPGFIICLDCYNKIVVPSLPTTKKGKKIYLGKDDKYRYQGKLDI